MNARRILALARKEWREILRDRLFFYLAFVVPPILLLVIGFGITTDVENIPFVIVDYDHTRLSRELGHKFIHSRYFAFRGYVADERQVASLIVSNRVRAAIVIPPQFQQGLRDGQTVTVQTIIDGAIPMRAETIKGYSASVIEDFSRRQLAAHLVRRGAMSAEAAAGMLQPVALHPRFLYNEAMRSRWAIGPGALMLVLALVPPVLTSVGVVREKESGSIDNVYASTLRREEFLLGKLLPYAALATINLFVLWGIVVWVFQVPFRGNPLLFAIVGVLYVLCTTLIGMVISFWVRTQIAAVIITVLLTMIPTIQYSGMLVPLSSLSDSGRMHARLLPASYFYEAMLASFLKGVGLEVIWPDIVALSVYVVLLFLFGYFKFTKRPRR